MRKHMSFAIAATIVGLAIFFWISADVVETSLTPLGHLIGQDETIEVVNEYIFIVLKCSIESRPHQQLVMGSRRTKELWVKMNNIESVMWNETSRGRHEVFVIATQEMQQMTERYFLFREQLGSRREGNDDSYNF